MYIRLTKRNICGIIMKIAKEVIVAVGYEALKKRAMAIVASRYIKPDAIYILYIFLLSITVIGLPIAYSVMQEYKRYLYSCLRQYDGANSDDKPKQKVSCEFKHPRSILFKYSPKTFIGALKAYMRIMLPFSACFFDMQHLDYDRNMEMKLGLVQLKMYFIYIFCAEILGLFLLCLIIFSGSAVCAFICALLIALMLAVLIKPLAAYCQAYVIYEKQCLDMPKDEADEQDDEE